MQIKYALVLLALLAPCTPWPGAIAQPHAPTAKLDARQKQAMTASIVAALEKDPLLAGPGPVVSGVERSTLAPAGGGSGWFIPLHIRYQGLSNEYCRLAMADSSLLQVAIVPLPPQALYDTCTRVNGQFVLDINEDGEPDVVQSVQIKSNRSNHWVTQAIVYLSAPGTAAHCYSSIASSLLTPVDLRSAASIAAAIRRSKASHGQQTFACQ